MTITHMRRWSRPSRAWLANCALLLTSVVVSLLVGEAALRMLDGKPILAWRNWLQERLVNEDISDWVSYDPEVGWRMKAGYRSPMMNTGPYGFRFTSGVTPQIVRGGIVAVGDSFTAGSEVNDRESWPAFLERLLGRPVLNGGVGGWGTDQILLRVEQLMELLDPEILLVGFLASDIERAGFSIYGGGAKPYFRIEGESLVRYNDPVPLPIEYRTDLTWFDRTLSYSYAYYRLTTAFMPDRMVYFGGQHYERIDNDPVAVTCKLLERTKAKSDAHDVRMILVLQYGGDIIREFALPPLHSRAVAGCARGLDLQVVDEFPSLRSVALRNANDLKSHYVMHGESTVYGHMSPEGNRHIAELIAAAIQNPDDRYPAQAYYKARDDEAPRLELGSGQPLLSESDDLLRRVGLAFAELTPEPGVELGKSYALSANGGTTEHYLATGLVATEPGLLAFSVWIDRKATRLAVLQLQDRDGRGAIVTVHLPTSSLDIHNLRDASVEAWFADERDGWARIAVSIRAEQDAVQRILQLVGRNWSRNFAPDGEVIRFSGMRLERFTGSDS